MQKDGLAVHFVLKQYPVFICRAYFQTWWPQGMFISIDI
jgi:hypothetical protein